MVNGGKLRQRFAKGNARPYLGSWLRAIEILASTTTIGEWRLEIGDWRFRSVALISTVLVLGCTPETPADELDELFTEEAEVIDLTHALSAGGSYWSSWDANPFTHDTIAAHPDGSPSMAAYSTPEHNGTHIDAPVHFAEGGRSVDELTSADLFGPAVVIDVSKQATANPDYVLTVADVEAWEAEHGAIPDGAIVLLNTGWSSKWNDLAAYQNRDAEGQMHFPGYGGNAARLLVERNIRGIGIDNLSVDAGAADGFPAHGVVNGADRFHLENVANMDRLPATGAYLIVAPIKIKGGSGGQVRIFAVMPR
jgi:kynurenine formamidase